MEEELNTEKAKIKLKETVEKYYKEIPGLDKVTEEQMQEFMQKDSVVIESIGWGGSSIRLDVTDTGEVKLYGTRVFYDEEMQADKYETFLSGEIMEDGTFHFSDYDEEINTNIDANDNINYEYIKVDRALKMNSEKYPIVTHFGDDLDNKSSIETLTRYARDKGYIAKDEKLIVKRVRAGSVEPGLLNVDTGGHKGSYTSYEEGNVLPTIVIDGDPSNGIKSASAALSKMGYYVPEQIVELADVRANSVSPLDSRSGLALCRYLTGSQVFALAEAGLLDKSLTDEQLEQFGLVESHKKQQVIIDTAVSKINEYTRILPNGEKIVLSPEQIKGGSLIAYETGIPYYVSVSDHFNRDNERDGVTFGITSKPGVKLPEQILQYGRELVEQYRIDEKSSGVFVHPNGQMIVAGGNKNPEFCIKGLTKEEMLNKIEENFIGKEKINSSTEIIDTVIEQTMIDTTEGGIKKVTEDIIRSQEELKKEEQNKDIDDK